MDVGLAQVHHLPAGGGGGHGRLAVREGQPVADERKAQFFQSAYNFVANKVRYDVRQENPFAAEAEIRLRFIELTQADDYPPETMDFIRAEMQKRIEAEWKARFRKMRESLGWNFEEMAAFLDASSGASLKASISRGLPAWAKLAVCVFEEMERRVEEEEQKP